MSKRAIDHSRSRINRCSIGCHTIYASHYISRYKTVEPADRNWGAMDEKTGKFNGMIGMLQRKVG